MPSRKGWIFTGVLRIGKVGSEVTRAMGRHGGAESRGTSEIPEPISVGAVRFQGQ